jgi:hypothetical protein
LHQEPELGFNRRFFPIDTGVLSGSGTIGASGSDSYYPYNGGGGRVAIYYEDISGFAVENIAVHGGNGNSSDAGAGTVYLKGVGQSYGDLIVDNSGMVTFDGSTPLRAVGKGTITGLTATVLTDDNANFPLPDMAAGRLGLIGLELDPNINDGDASTFTIIDNTATTITVDAADGDLTAVPAGQAAAAVFSSTAVF